MALYRLSASGGVVNTSTNQHIPSNTSNRAWAAYLDWVADGNTPDPVPTPALETYQAQQTALVDQKADALRAAYLPAEAGAGVVLLMRFSEADRCLADSAPNQTAPNYPLMAAEVPTTAATVALVATAVVAERLTLAGQLKLIEAARVAGVAAIAAAGSVAAVDAAVAAITWP